MRNRLIVSAVLVLFTMLTMPAFGEYCCHWYEAFESYSLGPLDGQGPWRSVNSTGSPVVTNYPVYAGRNAVRQSNGVSGALADLRYPSGPNNFSSGYAKFWIYDPGEVAGIVTDGRVGVISSNITPSGSAQVISAGVASSSSRDFWTLRWTYSNVVADGVSAPSGTGYAFTAGPAAERIYGSWNSVMISWSFTYTPSGGQAAAMWYINQTEVPNLTLRYDSTSTRWQVYNDVVGIMIGSYVQQANPTAVDNIEFHAIPEPSSLLMLGGGMIGLLGLIRRLR